MAKYELSDVQVRNLRAIIADANIKGRDSSAVIEIINSLSKPVQEMKIEETP